MTSPITCREGSSCSCHRFLIPAVEPFFKEQRASTSPEKSSSAVFPVNATIFSFIFDIVFSLFVTFQFNSLHS